MELFSNTWLIGFIVVTIFALIYLAAKIHYKSQNRHSYLEKLRTAGIYPTIRLQPNRDDLKGGDVKNNNP